MRGPWQGLESELDDIDVTNTLYSAPKRWPSSLSVSILTKSNGKPEPDVEGSLVNFSRTGANWWHGPHQLFV